MTRAAQKPGRKPAAKKPADKRPAGKPRRGHPAVELHVGLAQLIDSWLLEIPRPTYDEMIERLRGTGYHVSRSALARYGYKFEIQRRAVRMLVEKAKLLRTSDQDEVLALEEAVSQLLNTRILESLLGEDENGKPKALSDEELSTVVAAAKLQSSSAARERTRLAVTRGVDRALKILRAELEQLLRDDPPLLRRVLAKVEEVRQRQLGGAA